MNAASQGDATPRSALESLAAWVEAALERRVHRLAAGEARLLAGFNPDLLVFLLFLLLPVFGRVLRGLGERGKDATTNPGRGARGARQAPVPRAEARDAAPANEAHELERSGEEIWRKLLEGLAPEQTPTPAPPPPSPTPATRRAEPRAEPRAKPAVATQPARDPVRERKSVARSPELGSSTRPAAALSSQPRGAARLPGLAPSELADPSELGELAPVGKLGELERRPTPRALDARSASRSLSVSTSPDDLRRAVLWSEILAPPVALRWPSGSPWH